MSCNVDYEEEDDLVLAIANWYNSAYLEKLPCRTSILTGAAWVQEILTGNQTRCLQNFRMVHDVFDRFVRIASESGQLPDSRWVTLEERLAIFLYIVGQNASNRNAQERFQHSGESITRYPNVRRY